MNFIGRLSHELLMNFRNIYTDSGFRTRKIFSRALKIFFRFWDREKHLSVRTDQNGKYHIYFFVSHTINFIITSSYVIKKMIFTWYSKVQSSSVCQLSQQLPNLFLRSKNSQNVIIQLRRKVKMLSEGF